MNNTATITASGGAASLMDALKVACNRADLTANPVITDRLVNYPYTLFSTTSTKTVIYKSCSNEALAGKYIFIKVELNKTTSPYDMVVSVGVSDTTSSEPTVYKQLEIADPNMYQNLTVHYLQTSPYGFHAFESPQIVASNYSSFGVFENNCQPINGIIPLATLVGQIEGIHSYSVFYDIVKGEFLSSVPTMFTSYFCGTFKSIYSIYNSLWEGAIPNMQVASAGVRDDGTLKQPLVKLYAAIDEGVFDLSTSVNLYAFANIDSNINTPAINIGGNMYCFQHTYLPNFHVGLCFAYAAA